MDNNPKNPLHGVTLERLLIALVERHGWEALGRAVDIRCFTHAPSIQSSLVFLRRTPWARERVERLYITGDLSPVKPPPRSRTGAKRPGPSAGQRRAR